MPPEVHKVRGHRGIWGFPKGGFFVILLAVSGGRGRGRQQESVPGLELLKFSVPTAPSVLPSFL